MCDQEARRQHERKLYLLSAESNVFVKNGEKAVMKREARRLSGAA